MVVLTLSAIIVIIVSVAGAATASIITGAVIGIRNARQKLKPKPKGLPRSPPGRTREETRNNAIRILNMNITEYFNFAFCGSSGVGKSTLINAFRERDDVDPAAILQHDMWGSAATGEWQTTDKINQYAFPIGHQLQFVRLWDVVGCGTIEHPSATYFDDNTLYAFDFLIIVIDRELGEYEYTILKQARERNVPVAVVVNKIEMKIESKIRKQFNSRNLPFEYYKTLVDSTIEEARRRVCECLEKKQLENVSVFVISAFKYRDFTRNENVRAILTEHDVDISREISTSTSLDEDASQQETIHTNSIEQQNQSTRTDEELELTKLSLFSVEMSNLLQYIADCSVMRRF